LHRQPSRQVARIRWDISPRESVGAAAALDDEEPRTKKRENKRMMFKQEQEA
jgi:hypothetical protein